MSGDELTFSHSELRTFLTCPTLHRYRYLLERESTAPVPEALSKGRQVDLACACVEAGEPQSMLFVRPPSPEIRALISAWASYWPREQFVAEGHHVKFRFELDPGIELIGEFDAIGTYQGKRVILERKSSSEDISPGSPYWQKVELSDAQVSLYLLAAERLELGITEVLYDVLRKPALRLKKGETVEAFEQRCLEAITENPEHYFQRKLVTRLETERAAHVRDVHGTVKLLQVSAFLGDGTPRNTGSCWDYGRPCEFFPVCGTGASLDDPALYRVREVSRIRAEARAVETGVLPPELAEGFHGDSLNPGAASFFKKERAALWVSELPPAEAPQEPALFPQVPCAVCGTGVVCEQIGSVQTWLGPGRVGWRHVGCSPLGVIEAGLVEREETEPIPYRVVEDETERKARSRFSF